MNRIVLFALAALATASPAMAQVSNTRIVGRAADGTDRPILATSDGKLMTTGNGATGPAPAASSTSVTPASDGGAFPVARRGAPSIATGQVSVGTSATLVVAARTNRQNVGVSVTQAVQCAFGGPGVTLATGWPLPPTAYTSDNWDTASAVYAVCATAATNVAYREQF